MTTPSEREAVNPISKRKVMIATVRQQAEDLRGMALPAAGGVVTTNREQPYQLLPRLNAEEYAALEADIRNRGVQVPVERDESGNILDGHNRVEIATRLGIDYPAVVRTFATEAEKVEHVIKLNLARRHLDPIRWGQAFKKLLEARGVHTARGPKPKEAISATVAEIASEMGVPYRTARHRMCQAEQYDSLPEHLKDDVDNNTKTLHKAAREAERLEKASSNGHVQGCTVDDLQALVGNMTFGTIYADPPWAYQNQATRSATDNHYRTMSLADICALPVKDLAAPQCHLHLWTTNAFLPAAFEVLEAWGFEYKSVFVWCKPQMGIGNYWRVSHEFLLLGVRGQCSFADKSLMSWASLDRGQHSAKPHAVRAWVERASPGPRLELFSRQLVDGWVMWGDEIEQALFHGVRADKISRSNPGPSTCRVHRAGSAR
jgi:N6-adenosine-specific RNA methylase IME4